VLSSCQSWPGNCMLFRYCKGQGSIGITWPLLGPVVLHVPGTWKDWLIDWLIDYLRFYVPLKNISLIWKRHHCRWRAAKFRSMLGAQGLWACRDLYRVTPAVTRDLGFSGLIRRTAPFSRILRHTRGCGWSILTWIFTGWDLKRKKMIKLSIF
jgi:hypothetical protein